MYTMEWDTDRLIFPVEIGFRKIQIRKRETDTETRKRVISNHDNNALVFLQALFIHQDPPPRNPQS